jgi:hypothetical protein
MGIAIVRIELADWFMNEGRTRRLARQITNRAAMARGVIVLDEGLAGLAPALREANIKVVEIPPGTEDEVITQSYLPHRILVTKNRKPFLIWAPICEFGVVSLERLSVIDPSPCFAENKTAKLISEEISTNGLWQKGAMFLLELRDDGKHRLKPLE